MRHEREQSGCADHQRQRGEAVRLDLAGADGYEMGQQCHMWWIADRRQVGPDSSTLCLRQAGKKFRSGVGQLPQVWTHGGLGDTSCGRYHGASCVQFQVLAEQFGPCGAQRGRRARWLRRQHLPARRRRAIGRGGGVLHLRLGHDPDWRVLLFAEPPRGQSHDGEQR